MNLNDLVFETERRFDLINRASTPEQTNRHLEDFGDWILADHQHCAVTLVHLGSSLWQVAQKLSVQQLRHGTNDLVGAETSRVLRALEERPPNEAAFLSSLSAAFTNGQDQVYETTFGVIGAALYVRRHLGRWAYARDVSAS